MDPLYSVAVQLKTLMADGTATRKLRNEKHHAGKNGLAADKHVMSPDQEANESNGQAEKTLQMHIQKPAYGQKQRINSLTTPIPGKIIMYTAGCE